MAARAPHEPDTSPVAASLNAAPKFVVSNTLTSADWAGTQIVTGDAAAAPLRLVACTQTTAGVLLLGYEPAR
jgi:hypothetical protein